MTNWKKGMCTCGGDETLVPTNENVLDMFDSDSDQQRAIFDCHMVRIRIISDRATSVSNFPSV